MARLDVGVTERGGIYDGAPLSCLDRWVGTGRGTVGGLGQMRGLLCPVLNWMCVRDILRPLLAKSARGDSP